MRLTIDGMDGNLCGCGKKSLVANNVGRKIDLEVHDDMETKLLIVKMWESSLVRHGWNPCCCGTNLLIGEKNEVRWKSTSTRYKIISCKNMGPRASSSMSSTVKSMMV